MPSGLNEKILSMPFALVVPAWIIAPLPLIVNVDLFAATIECRYAGSAGDGGAAVTAADLELEASEIAYESPAAVI